VSILFFIFLKKIGFLAFLPLVMKCRLKFSAPEWVKDF